MSDAHNEHESLIKTPRQLIVAVVAGFLVPIITIILIVHYVSSSGTLAAGSDAASPESVAARLQPVADAAFTLVDANAPKQLLAGDAVYKQSCAACHDTGAAGAPRLGDAAGWSARIGKGQADVVANAINGIRGMPAKGGNPDLDDIEVERAVVYLVNQSGGKFKEPEVPAAAPAAPTTTANEPAQGAQVASATEPLNSPSQQIQSATPAEQTASVDGKKVYEASCAACHTPGVAGAPKLGDKAAWAPRVEQGEDTLYANAIKGFQGKAGFMPPRGGSSASDEEVKAAVDYMVNAAK